MPRLKGTLISIYLQGYEPTHYLAAARYSGALDTYELFYLLRGRL